jgi:hypothetical protein
MAKQFQALTPEHSAFIAKQHLFFTASATAEGRINLSPKGLGGFRVISETSVCYLDLTGSGAETAAHLLADGRLTIMFCALEGPPLILRLYGTATSIMRGTSAYAELLSAHFQNEEPPGARQIIVQSIEMVQTSCGYGVPTFAYEGERPSLINWAQAKGEEGLKAYRAEKNTKSLDGLPTGFGVNA